MRELEFALFSGLEVFLFTESEIFEVVAVLETTAGLLLLLLETVVGRTWLLFLLLLLVLFLRVAAVEPLVPVLLLIVALP